MAEKQNARKGSSDASASPDRRIARSKRALRDALIQLMEEKGFDAITVNDLCGAADLTRGTFYNHFESKEQLLMSLEDEIMDEIIALQEQMTNLTLRDMVRYRSARVPMPLLVQLFDYLREQADFLHAALGPGGDVRFGSRLRDTVCTNIIESLLHERYRKSNDPFVEYYVSFYASAYLGVITQWIETGMEQDSSLMARIAVKLLFIKPGDTIKL